MPAGYVYMPVTHASAHAGGCIPEYISAWASALLVQTMSGNAKASMRGTGNSTDSRAFSYMAKAFR